MIALIFQDIDYWLYKPEDRADKMHYVPITKVKICQIWNENILQGIYLKYNDLKAPISNIAKL